jgi:hypothetical protein
MKTRGFETASMYKRFVHASETLDNTQPKLFDEVLAESGTGKKDESEKETITYQRNKHKMSRKPLPENLTWEDRNNPGIAVCIAQRDAERREGAEDGRDDGTSDRGRRP